MTIAGGGAALKVCGATTTGDIDLLAAAGAGYVGLWHGVPGGPADLTLDRLGALAGHARDRRIKPVLVTFAADVPRLRDVLARTGIEHLQLHAYQPPAVVRGLRADRLTILKVLHLRDGGCVEGRFVPAYARAGTDVFLLDHATADGRVGSTGHPLSPAAVLALLPALDRPFLLAGGLTADNRAGYAAVTADPHFAGIDVDTAARDGQGHFDAARVAALGRAWRTDRTEELTS